MTHPRLIQVETGRVFSIPHGETVAGRNPECGIVVSDPSVSGRHALLLPSADGRCLVRDLESTNGIKVNDAQVTEALLSPNDFLALGSRSFVYQSAPAPPPFAFLRQWWGIGTCGAIAALILISVILAGTLAGIAAIGYLMQGRSLSDRRLEKLLCAEFPDEPVEFNSVQLAEIGGEGKGQDSLELAFDRELKRLVREGCFASPERVAEASESPLYQARKLSPTANAEGCVGICIYDPAFWNPYTIAGRGGGEVVKVERRSDEVSVAQVKLKNGEIVTREVRTDGWHKIELHGLSPTSIRIEQRLLDSKTGIGDVAFRVFYAPNRHAKKWIRTFGGHPFVAKMFSERVGPLYWAHIRRLDDGWKVVSLKQAEVSP